MAFEMFTFDGLQRPTKSAKRVCGCHMEKTRLGVPMVVCPGVRRFADRKTAAKLFELEQQQGTFCIYVKKGKRCKTGYKRKGGRCVRVGRH